MALRCVPRNVAFAVPVLEVVVSAPFGGRHTAATLARLEPRHPLAEGIPPATNPPTLWVFERGLRPRRPPYFSTCRYTAVGTPRMGCSGRGRAQVRPVLSASRPEPFPSVYRGLST